jgi:hypothetical protein
MEEYEILVEPENIFEEERKSFDISNIPVTPQNVNEEFFKDIILEDIKPTSIKVFTHYGDLCRKTTGVISVSMILGSCVLLIQSSMYLNWVGVGLAVATTGFNMLSN